MGDASEELIWNVIENEIKRWRWSWKVESAAQLWWVVDRQKTDFKQKRVANQNRIEIAT